MKENDRQIANKTDKKRDINSKMVLGNPILCAQFLRRNVDIPCLKNVQPEDIEDVSERYRPYLGTEFESDTVKRIRIHDVKMKDNSDQRTTSDRMDSQASESNRLQEPLFVVSLTEHKSRVDYDVSMQLLKYMLCIWLDYSKEMKAQKAGVSDRKGFRYPVIIPVVYYEGKAPWTADRQFRSRIFQGELFKDWIPDFTYEVVRLHDYSNEELLERGDEMSLIMLFNKIQDAVDVSEFLKLPQEKLDEMVRDTPETVIDVIVSVMESLCSKIGATDKETQECVSRVRERRMGYLFENMEKMNIQEERRNTAEARAEAEKAKRELEEAKREVEEVKREAEKFKREAEESKDSAIQSVIRILQGLNKSRAEIIQKIIEEFGLDREKAQQKVDIYWNDVTDSL